MDFCAFWGSFTKIVNSFTSGSCERRTTKTSHLHCFFSVIVLSFKQRRHLHTAYTLITQTSSVMTTRFWLEVKITFCFSYLQAISCNWKKEKSRALVYKWHHQFSKNNLKIRKIWSRVGRKLLMLILLKAFEIWTTTIGNKWLEREWWKKQCCITRELVVLRKSMWNAINTTGCTAGSILKRTMLTSV